MANKLMSQSFEDFAAVLAAKEPVPGGGSAAAYVGALAVSLCSMVGNYTLGKKAYAAVETDIEQMLVDAELVRLRLLELMYEDAEAFYPLSLAYSIPKEDPTREEHLEAATKWAAAPPMEMMRQICRAIELLEEMGEKGSRMLVSDVGSGACLARAALEAASLNVFVNTRGLADRAYARTLEDEADAMLREFVPRAQACADAAMQKIRG